MAAMAGVFFVYAASGLVVPVWALTGLIFVWLVLFVTACRWFMPHPWRVVVVGLLSLAAWLVVVLLTR